MKNTIPALFLMPLILISCVKENKVVYKTKPSIKKGPEDSLLVENAHVKKKGQICELNDYDVHESQKIFLVFDKTTIDVYRYDEDDKIAYPGVRTSTSDIFRIFEDSDHKLIVSLVPRMQFNDYGIWKSHAEVIDVEKFENGIHDYVLHRTRFLRKKDQFSQKDWVKSSPEPFYISFCRDDEEVEIKMKFLPSRKEF